MASSLMHRLPPRTVNRSLESVSSDSDNESFSSSSVDEFVLLSSDSVSCHQEQIPRSTHSTTRSAAATIGSAATTAIAFTLMNAVNPDPSQEILNATAAFATGAVTYVALNSSLLRPLISKVDEWINEGMRMFREWGEGEGNLASQRHKYSDLENRIWNFLTNRRIEVVAGGVAGAGITFNWKEIIGFIKEYAPVAASQTLEKMMELRSKLDIIINSPAALSTGIVAGLATIAYGLYIAYGASQQLKTLNEISFQPVKDAFDQALNQFMTNSQAANGSAARVRAAFTRLELSVMKAQDKLKSIIREVTYHHNEALKNKGRAKLIGHVALGVSSVFAIGAISAGAKVLQSGAGIFAAAKAGACTQSAGLSLLFLSGCGTCEFGSNKCQLVIDKCEELQQEGMQMISTISDSLINVRMSMEELLEQHTNST